MIIAGGGNPMDFFQMGRAGGAARSPVFGIGSAIRGILEQSQKLGLINAQSMGNLATGVATAGFKSQLDRNQAAAVGPQPASSAFIDPETKKTLLKNYTYDEKSGQWVQKISPASFNFMERITGGGVGGVNPIDEKLDVILNNLFTTEQ